MKNLLTLPERKELVSQIGLADTLNIRSTENGLKYFVPTGKQEEFSAAVGKGEHFIFCFSGANGPGKTAAMVNISGNFIWPDSNKRWFNYPFYNNWPYPKRIRIGSNHTNLEKVGAIQTEIKSWWPVNKYKADKNGKKYLSIFEANGWIVDLMSYDQDVTEWESSTIGVAIFDEPPPKKILDATIARMRQGGIILVFMTPLHQAGYFFDDIVAKREGLKPGEGVYVLHVDIEDSCVDHGVRGFLKHADIQKMTAFYDDEEKEARIHGRPTHLSGRIYKPFNENVHRVKDFIIPGSWPKVHIVDPHDARPFAMGWCAFNEIDDIYVYDEWPHEPFEKIRGSDETFNDYAAIIRNKEGKSRIAWRGMDPNFGEKTYGPKGRQTVREEMAKFGLNYDTDITDDLDVGHRLVRERLQYDIKKPLGELNKPKLYILERCRNHWFSMARYSYEDQRNARPKEKVPIAQNFKHFPDLIRYLIVKGLSYTNLAVKPPDKKDYGRKRPKPGSAMGA